MTPLGDALNARSNTVRLRGGISIDRAALDGIVTRAGMLGSADVAVREYLARRFAYVPFFDANRSVLCEAVGHEQGRREGLAIDAALAGGAA